MAINYQGEGGINFGTRAVMVRNGTIGTVGWGTLFLLDSREYVAMAFYLTLKQASEILNLHQYLKLLNRIEA